MSLSAAGGINCKFENADLPCGFPAPGSGIFFFDDLASWEIFGTTVGINKVTLLVVFAVVLVLGFFLYAFRKPQIVPRGAQNVGETGYLFIRDGIARDVIGKEGDKFVPFLFSFFFLIWTFNFFGILPFVQFPITSVFAIPVAFALIVYFTWVPLGIYRQGFAGFFKGMLFPPGVPKPMYLLLAPIEFISNIIVRPFTHAVRLFANMFAGHLLLATFSIAAYYLLTFTLIGIIGSAASFTMAVALTAFELLIQALQAYIFTLLTAVYISGALHAEH
ncbi:MAG: F0F1 ATP synthase subunit A [Candidatus Nanopelagicales bacterium]|jgi:F-type H+-transporting ATPase subunit a|nr:F0F1 ATP synthase subunit A [Candidatus Nanopelagicales bacterium]MDP4905946.1 F0F1 ATP synthase subunit A [Candidatus Nanopelagicales bacterium]MDP4975040.1 F0F1 ATP synthase subunit A [Candidatus Nanopelagicales bacterium]